MKRLIFLIAFLITSFAFSQGGGKVDALKFRGKVTTTIRDNIDVPTGEYWIIHNSTTGKVEVSDETDVWTDINDAILSELRLSDYTTTERNALDVPVGETWVIYNSTSNSIEVAESDDVWSTVGDGLQSGSNSLPGGVSFNQSITNSIEIIPENSGVFGNNPAVRILAGNQDDAVFFVMYDDTVSWSFASSSESYTINPLGETNNSDLTRKEYVDAQIAAINVSPDNSVVETTIVNNSVTTNKISDNAITGVKIQAATISKSKLDTSVSNSLDLADTAIQSDSDNQQLTRSGNTLTLEDGGSVDLSDLAGGGGTFDDSGLLPLDGSRIMLGNLNAGNKELRKIRFARFSDFTNTDRVFIGMPSNDEYTISPETGSELSYDFPSQKWSIGGNAPTIDALAGTGNRMLVANATGELSTQAIPSGGSGTSIVTNLSLNGNVIENSNGTGVDLSGIIANGDVAIISPEQFGAVGDFNDADNTGTDDSAAFQAMIDAIPNTAEAVNDFGDPKVVIRLGANKRYLLNSKIDVHYKINLIIDLNGSLLINNTTDSFAIDFRWSQGASFFNGQLKLQNDNVGVGGFSFYKTRYNNFYNVKILKGENTYGPQQFNTVGIYCVGGLGDAGDVLYNKYDKVWFRGLGTSIVLETPDGEGAFSRVNSNHFTEVISFSRVGVKLRGVWGNRFTGLDIEGATTPFILETNDAGLPTKNNYFEVTWSENVNSTGSLADPASTNNVFEWTGYRGYKPFVPGNINIYPENFAELLPERNLITDGEFLDGDAAYSSLSNTVVANGKATMTITNGASATIGQGYEFTNNAWYRLKVVASMPTGTSGRLHVADDAGNQGGLSPNDAANQFNLTATPKEFTTIFKANQESEIIYFTRGINSGNYTIDIESVYLERLDDGSKVYYDNATSGLAANDVQGAIDELVANGGTGGVPTIATQAEAEGGTNNTATMTPLRTAQAITALAPTGGAGVDQTLSISGQDLTISGTNGNTVTLPSIGGGSFDAAADYNPTGTWSFKRLGSNFFNIQPSINRITAVGDFNVGGGGHVNGYRMSIASPSSGNGGLAIEQTASNTNAYLSWGTNSSADNIGQIKANGNIETTGNIVALGATFTDLTNATSLATDADGNIIAGTGGGSGAGETATETLLRDNQALPPLRLSRTQDVNLNRATLTYLDGAVIGRKVKNYSTAPITYTLVDDFVIDDIIYFETVLGGESNILPPTGGSLLINGVATANGATISGNYNLHFVRKVDTNTYDVVSEDGVAYVASTSIYLENDALRPTPNEVASLGNVGTLFTDTFEVSTTEVQNGTHSIRAVATSDFPRISIANNYGAGTYTVRLYVNVVAGNDPRVRVLDGSAGNSPELAIQTLTSGTGWQLVELTFTATVANWSIQVYGNYFNAAFSDFYVDNLEITQ